MSTSVADRTRLAGKAIVVTGAAQGIGAAVAEHCCAEGARVGLVDRSEAVTETAARLGPRATAVVCDVTDADATERTVADLAGRMGAITGLVNAAAIQRKGDAATLGDDDWRAVMEVNVDAPLRWIRTVLPHLLAAGAGSIVNITSVTASAAIPQAISYVTSKHALLGITRSVAVDFGRRGVRCNAVSPGTIETAFFAEYARADPEKAAGLVDLNYVGRLGTPEEVAALCALLLSEEVGFVNGANLAIDGGRLIGI